MAVPCCLTIAGSDSGGGAGIQADLKAFARAGCFGTSAIVALTAQNTGASPPCTRCRPSFVTAQLDAVFSDFEVDAAKTGMLFSRPIVEAVAAFLAPRPLPLVVDPVMVATSGAQLLEDDAVGALVELLFPLATVVTPNHLEAEALAGRSGTKRELAEAIVALGARAVVVTGGHGDEAVDWLFDGHGAHADPRRPRGGGCHARSRLHALGDARGAARAGCGALRGRARRSRDGSPRGRGRSRRARRRRRPRRRLRPRVS